MDGLTIESILGKVFNWDRWTDRLEWMDRWMIRLQEYTDWILCDAQ